VVFDGVSGSPPRKFLLSSESAIHTLSQVQQVFVFLLSSVSVIHSHSEVQEVFDFQGRRYHHKHPDADRTLL
jgi:hypothetical protein